MITIISLPSSKPNLSFNESYPYISTIDCYPLHLYLESSMTYIYNVNNYCLCSVWWKINVRGMEDENLCIVL